MRITLLASAALALTLSIGGSAYAQQWSPRTYWQWDERPIWDDPWTVLRPNFWGSPEPYLMPADIWACEWHLPGVRYWRWHRRHCRSWQ
jgi:hypothetical protein